jgi:hypothetical protein
MSLTTYQTSILDAAIAGYAYPAVYFDFAAEAQIVSATMVVCESEIRSQLLSNNPYNVMNGLSNVIYWGNATAGYRDHRVAEFREAITLNQLSKFQNLVAGGIVPTLRQIKDLQMRGFSGMSFVSKVLMFLDPMQYCVLDKQITKLRTPNGHGSVNLLKYGTQIDITVSNEDVYNDWRAECMRISDIYFDNRYRAVDIERGFFNLIQNAKLSAAQQIYENA